jgi:hypothetical protein
METITRDGERKSTNDHDREVMTAGKEKKLTPAGVNDTSDTRSLYREGKSSAATVCSKREARPVPFGGNRLAVFFAWVVVVVAGGVMSCVRDMQARQGALLDGEALVTLAMDVPGIPASRATDPGTEKENTISEIDVLLFDATTDKYRYRAIGSATTDLGAPGDVPHQQKSFTVKLPLGDYRVLVIANARASIPALYAPAALAGADNSDKTREQVHEELLLALPGSNAAGNLPMWGYYKGAGNSTVLEISGETSNVTPDITLVRAMSRVDVRLHASVDNFTVKEVYLLNYYKKGHLATRVGMADADGYDGDYWDAGARVVKKPHVEDIDASTLKASGPGEYILRDDDAFTGNLYAFEAPAGKAVGAEGWEENTCLVIGGKYGGETAPVTYYRVEFMDTRETGEGEGVVVTHTPLPLLRNHLYDVVIQSVGGPGYPGVTEAYYSKPVNLQVNIVPWNNGGIDQVVFGGQHYLAVDKSTVTLYKDTDRPKELTVITDYPGNWTTEIPAECDWFTISNGSGPGDETPGTLTVTPASAPPSGTRDGHFFVVAGNLKKRVDVTQLDERDLALEISTRTLLFDGTPSTYQTVTLDPYPLAGGTVSFSSVGEVTWEAGYGPGDYSSGDNIQLKPTQNMRLVPINGIVLVTFTDGDGRTLTKWINVVQNSEPFEFTLVEEYVNQSPMSATGGTHFIMLTTDDTRASGMEIRITTEDGQVLRSAVSLISGFASTDYYGNFLSGIPANDSGADRMLLVQGGRDGDWVTLYTNIQPIMTSDLYVEAMPVFVFIGNESGNSFTPAHLTPGSPEWETYWTTEGTTPVLPGECPEGYRQLDNAYGAGLKAETKEWLIQNSTQSVWHISFLYSNRDGIDRIQCHTYDVNDGNNEYIDATYPFTKAFRVGCRKDFPFIIGEE